jgi:hypothetical protein
MSIHDMPTGMPGKDPNEAAPVNEGKEVVPSQEDRLRQSILSDYARRNGSCFSNFENSLYENKSPEGIVDRERFAKIVLKEALDQGIYYLSDFVSTGNERAFDSFHHGLSYLAQVVRGQYPDVYELLQRMNGHEAITQESAQGFLDTFSSIRASMDFEMNDYYVFPEAKGVSKEEVLRECLYFNLGQFVPLYSKSKEKENRSRQSKDLPEELWNLYVEWESAKKLPIREFLQKSKALFNAWVAYEPEKKYDFQYFILQKTLEEGESIFV